MYTESFGPVLPAYGLLFLPLFLLLLFLLPLFFLLLRIFSHSVRTVRGRTYTCGKVPLGKSRASAAPYYQVCFLANRFSKPTDLSIPSSFEQYTHASTYCVRVLSPLRLWNREELIQLLRNTLP